LRTYTAFNRQFDCAGRCNALLSCQGNQVPVSFSAIARSKLIPSFAGFTRVGIEVGVTIHTVRLRVGRSLGVRWSDTRQDRRQPHRKAGNQAHYIL